MAIQEWRLNNLYRVEDKAGRIVPFKLNDAQSYFYRTMWYLSIILKARQLGFSTLISIFFLDVCLFNPNTHCGIIDATIDDAKKKLGKILFAYDGLPDWVKAGCPIASRNAFEIVFANGSSILVGTSHRGGTLQYLHISELGKIAAKFPEKAREIRTGALNTIQAGQFCFIESTAEGQDGDFYDACQVAEAKARQRQRLTKMDFKFHFFPWHGAKEYQIDPNGVVIPVEMENYFSRLQSERNIILTPGQKAWYVKKAETQREDMKREFPSTPEEAFEASIEGAIFGKWMANAEEAGQIGDYKAHDGVAVHMFADIGRKDYTSFWFAQVFAGKVRCVGFYQNTLEGLPHYTEYCFGTAHAKKVHPGFQSRKDIKGIFEINGWKVGKAVFPHDIKVEEWGSARTRIEMAIAAGFDAEIATSMGFHDGINAARGTIPLTDFDAEGCGVGLKMLKNYRWAWDDIRGVFLTGTEPRHDINSHGSDAYRYLSTSWRELPTQLEPKPKLDHSKLKFAVNTETGALETNMTIQQLVEQRKRAKAKLQF
jgi:hypothetical protein